MAIRTLYIATLALAGSLLPVHGVAAQFLVAHQETGITTISRQDIRRMYLNQKPKWPSGQRVMLAIRAKGKQRDHFLRIYIGKNSARFDRHWKRQLFTGKGIPPESFSSQKALLDYVRNTPGALACIETDTPPTRVQVLKVTE